MTARIIDPAASRLQFEPNPSRYGIVGMYHYGMPREMQLSRAAQMLANGYSLAFVMELMRPASRP